MLTQTPRSPSASGSFPLIEAAARRSTLKLPIRFTAMTLEKYSRLWGPPLCATRSAQPIPAQQTDIRRPPPALAARSTAVPTASASVTFVSTKSAPISAASASPFSALRSAMTTLAPASASAREVAAPSPEAPPATSAPAPSTFIGATLSARD